MADLTQGYSGGGRGTTRILDAILAIRPITIRAPVFTLGSELFRYNFMPYANRNWSYNGVTLNCEDLARAFVASIDYVRSKRLKAGLADPVPTAQAVNCTSLAEAIISNNFNFFRGPARGNISNSADCRCLFGNHWLAQVGTTYFDPTFNRETRRPDDCIQRRLKRLAVNKEKATYLDDSNTFLYIQQDTTLPGFSCSYKEYDANLWITCENWNSYTARSGHFRSSALKEIDQAFGAYEKDRSSSNLNSLKTTFKNWYENNPAEVSHRNTNDCISHLAHNLGLAEELLKNP